MNRWIGKVAVVTGASSGIGATIAKELALAGMIVVGMARRVQLIEALKEDLPAGAAARLYAIRCDVTKETDILEAFDYIERKFGGVDVMVNNAGINESPGGSREAYLSMKARGVNGHIIHIGSHLGHEVEELAQISIYSPTKFAVRGLTEAMRIQLRNEKSGIRVSGISPHLVRTRLTADLNEVQVFLETGDIAQAVVYQLAAPPHVQVHDIVVRPILDYQ
ncbi:farnesol dehydrogenase-like [Uranotaenia lowii]|uniref:farnesol dehydrogenase-like n=1 Tax=Uranotaenia lowii TaxID=190385 RepID=UPI002479A2A0|nr:farnesol dehydrogenase-like [Uranotaenia lowii]